MFAIDFDGTIADTNSLKSLWILEHLGIQIPPSACDLTTCISKIGSDQYERMSAVVYEAEHSLKALPIPGSQQAVTSLSNHGEIYVITARDQGELPAVSEWLSKHELDQHISRIMSSDGDSKIQIAGSIGCTVLIDDDIRHLESESLPQLMRILLKVGIGVATNIPSHVTLCTTWRDATEKALEFHLDRRVDNYN